METTYPVSPVAGVVTVRFGRELFHYLDFIWIAVVGQEEGYRLSPVISRSLCRGVGWKTGGTGLSNVAGT